MIFELLNQLPASSHLYIMRNGHNASYESIIEYLNEDHIKDVISYEDAQECLAKNTIWELQIYTRTPISFYKTIAASLERCIELMLQNCKEGVWV